FDRRAAARLADRDALQSGGLPRKRLSLELLRDRGCACRREPRDDRAVPARLLGRDLVDLQDRLPPEDVDFAYALARVALLIGVACGARRFALRHGGEGARWRHAGDRRCGEEAPYRAACRDRCTGEKPAVLA